MQRVRQYEAQASHSSVPQGILRDTTSKAVSWGGVLCWGMLLFSSGILPAWAQSPAATEKPGRQAALAYLNNLQEAFAAVADEVEPAVCTVLSFKAQRVPREGGDEDGSGFFGRRPRRSTGTGTGLIISKDGWVLTNDHVAGGADKVTVRLQDGREFPGTVRRDPLSDLALVKITSSSPFPFVRLGDSDKVKVGHWAIAIGTPFRYEGSFSVGVISSLHRQQEIIDPNAPRGRRFYPTMFQTDAAINPGNSGGPLCNIQGEVIGINTAIETDNGGSVGIGFAIPINTAKFVIRQLMEKGRVSYGYLGVYPTSVTPRLASILKVEQGALVQQTPEPMTPAGKAGLQAGDVVVEINKKLIRNELDLRTLVGQTAPGTTIDLVIVRNGQKQALKATIEEPPPSTRGESLPETKPEGLTTKPAPRSKTRLGIEVQTLTEKLAKKIEIPLNTPGVVIKSLSPDSDAANQLEEGMIIMRVNNIETPNIQAFQSATASLKSGDKVKLVVKHKERQVVEKFIVVTVD